MGAAPTERADEAGGTPPATPPPADPPPPPPSDDASQPASATPPSTDGGITGSAPAARPDPDPDPSIQDCALVRDLTKHDLVRVGASLAGAGYRRLQELGSDEKAVVSAVRQADKQVLDGEVQRVLALWREATKKSPPVAAPKLPEGTKIDLSQSSITVGDVKFELPTQLQTKKDTTTYKTAAELKDVDWLVIARATRMMHAIHMDRALNSQKADDGIADDAALVWKVPSGRSYLNGQASAGVFSGLSYTSRSSNLVHNRITEGALEFSSPFASGSASAARNEKQARSELKKRLYMTGTWRYAYAQLTLTECTELADRFIEAIDAALQQQTQHRKFEALRGVFDRFGHAMPRYVTLGGQLYFQADRRTIGEIDEGQVTNTVKAALTAKYGGSGGGASASFQDAEGHKVDAQSISETTSFIGVGGDVTLVSNPAEWAGTSKDPNRWAVISRDQLIPLVDRLDQSRHAAVTEVWDAGLRSVWGTTPPRGYLLPDLDGRPFTVATTDAAALVLTPSGIDKGLATLSTSNLLADPLPHGLGWELQYSGKTTAADGRGQPIYWIVEYLDESLKDARQLARKKATAKNKAVHDATGLDDTEPVPAVRVALAAVKHKDDWSAGCLDVDLAGVGGSSPEDSPAAWTLTPADPSGYQGEAYDHAYLLRNISTQRVLGKVVIRSDIHLDQPTACVELVNWSDETTAGPVWSCRTQNVTSAVE
jgi:hypothetical protein